MEIGARGMVDEKPEEEFFAVFLQYRCCKGGRRVGWRHAGMKAAMLGSPWLYT